MEEELLEFATASPVRPYAAVLSISSLISSMPFTSSSRWFFLWSEICWSKTEWTMAGLNCSNVDVVYLAPAAAARYRSPAAAVFVFGEHSSSCTSEVLEEMDIECLAAATCLSSSST